MGVPMHPILPVRAVILDLDGTLIDTAGEIVEAMDRTLDELRLARVPAAEVTKMIGRGVPKLVERVMHHLAASRVDLDAAVSRFEAHYAQTVGTSAELFPGVQPGLQRLDEMGMALAVVTNK